MIIWICIAMFLIAAGCSSSSKDESAQTSSDSADLAAGRNEEKTAEVNQAIQGLENEEKQGIEKARAEDARRTEADPKNVPFGGSREFESEIPRPFDPFSNKYASYINVTFPLTDCLTSAGIKAWFGNISEDDRSARITYTVSVDALGEGGYQAFLDSIKGCKTSIPMFLTSEDFGHGQRGITPKFLRLRISEFGIHVDEPSN